MSQKIVIIIISSFLAATILLLIFIKLFLFKTKEHDIVEEKKQVFSGKIDLKTAYIFDKDRNVKANDVMQSQKNISFDKDDNVKIYFSNKLINPHTIKYFKYLQNLFKINTGLTNHLDEVQKYLFTQWQQNEASELYKIYKSYIQSELNLMEAMKTWGTPSNPESLLEFLAKAQAFRRSSLGEELADALFGAEIKAQEYSIRRGMIINDKDAYGEEKEQKLKALDQDMWGDEAEVVDNYPDQYTQYREKLEIYKKNLDEASSEDDRNTKIKKFREDFFSPEVIKKLEDIDRKLTGEKQVEDKYYLEERKILEDTKLSPAEKQHKKNELQNKFFGDEAEAFRRRENIKNQR
ncbi:MAG: hypothetical protein HQK79_15795 [Desulfobacterales bacterium]|nr:hypothetical protein [Desulfobacterales bacterium]